MAWVAIAIAVLGLYFLWRFCRAVSRSRRNFQIAAPKEESARAKCVRLPGPQSPFQPVILLVPEFCRDEPAIRMIKSFEDRGVQYEINLSVLTCTCPDFMKRRTAFPGRDARRVCKHLCRRLQSSEFWTRLDPLLQVFLSEHHPSPHLYQAKIGDKNIILFGVTPGEEWLNVFTRRRHKGEMPGNFTGEYKRYGFSVERNGWAYGDHPAGAHEIRQLISHFVSE